ncbi:putative ribonuclease H-like domain-containing protein [Tanacetum coccineum]
MDVDGLATVANLEELEQAAKSKIYAHMWVVQMEREVANDNQIARKLLDVVKDVDKRIASKSPLAVIGTKNVLLKSRVMSVQQVLGEVNVELDSGTIKLREKLSQEEDSEEKALEEFNAALDNVLEKLSQEKDSLDDLYGFMHDTDDDACISGKLKKEDQVRGLEVPKKRWSRFKSQRRNADKDQMMLLVFGS